MNCGTLKTKKLVSKTLISGRLHSGHTFHGRNSTGPIQVTSPLLQDTSPREAELDGFSAVSALGTVSHDLPTRLLTPSSPSPSPL